MTTRQAHLFKGYKPTFKPHKFLFVKRVNTRQQCWSLLQRYHPKYAAHSADALNDKNNTKHSLKSPKVGPFHYERVSKKRKHTLYKPTKFDCVPLCKHHLNLSSCFRFVLVVKDLEMSIIW